ncbi:MAG: regulatory protein GemA [Rhodoferax sp.]|nr:regulatory protein GemA [Rhodoferax sp.]MDP3652428.1 regulatory protein GemA [Rhodoferax sp.]
MSKPAPRQSHLAAIHMAQKALGISADDAISIKLHVTGKASAADMSAPQRQMYLAHLSGLQASQALARGEKPAYTPQRAPQHRAIDDDQDERWSKARALWGALATAGVVRTNTDAALMAYVKRQTKVDAWRFLNSHQVNTVIEALKRWCRRTDVPTEATK